MKQLKPYKPTSRSFIRSALRRYIWMRCAERAAALKRDKYTCQGCGRKQSKAKGKEFKVDVHHIDGIDHWQEIIDLIIDNLLQTPENLVTMCKGCHKKEHDG